MHVQGFSLTILLTLSNVVTVPESPPAQISLPAFDIAPSFVRSSPGLPGPFEGPSEGLVTVGNSVCVREESREEPRRCRSCFSVPYNTY